MRATTKLVVSSLTVAFSLAAIVLDASIHARLRQRGSSEPQ